MKQSKNFNSDHGFSYEAVTNSQKYVIHSGNTHPLQLSLGKIAKMSTISDSIGQGWDRTRDLTYFNKSNNSEIQRQEVTMTTSHQFEE
jgi:hypothetical protein